MRVSLTSEVSFPHVNIANSKFLFLVFTGKSTLLSSIQIIVAKAHFRWIGANGL